MSQIAVYRVSENEVVYVEAAEPPIASGEQRASIETIGKFLNGDSSAEPPELESRLSPIIGALRAIREKVSDVGSPDQIELSAGLKFTGSAGVILSNWGSEASVSIKLTWKKDERGGSPSKG